MSKLSKEQFDAYLEQIKELAEGPFEEMQPEIEVTNVFPEKFYELAKENDLYRFALPAEYGGWDLRSSTSCAFRSSSPVVLAACVCTCTMLLT